MRCLNDICCEQNKTCRWDRVLGRGPAADQMNRSTFLQRWHLKWKLMTRGASHARIGGKEEWAKQWGHMVGHGPCQPGGRRPDRHSSSTGSLARCLPPTPTPALWSFVGAAVSMSPKTQLLGPAQRWLALSPCIYSQPLANRWRSVNACGIVE